MGCLKLDILEENYSPLKVVRDDLKTTVEGCTGAYLFGFNGQEKEDEIYGEGNAYSAEFWMYDARLGRRWNLDPVPQISISDYAVMGLNPILNIDPKGDSWWQNKESGEMHFTEKNNDYTDDNIPENVEYVGDDEMFGVEAFLDAMVSADTRTTEQVENGEEATFQPVVYSLEQSKKIAEAGGMKIVPTKQLVGTETLKMTQRFGNQVEGVSFSIKEEINLAYSIVDKWASPQISSMKNISKEGNPGMHFNRIDIVDINYNESNTYLKVFSNYVAPVIKLVTKYQLDQGYALPSMSLDQVNTTSYPNASEYPSSGVLYEPLKKLGF